MGGGDDGAAGVDGAVGRAEQRVVVHDVGRSHAGMAVGGLDVEPFGVLTLLDDTEGAGEEVATLDGVVLSPVAKTKTSWPAASRPRAKPSMTDSVPPYAGGGTGTQGGAMMAMRIVIRCGYPTDPRHKRCEAGGALLDPESQQAGVVT